MSYAPVVLFVYNRPIHLLKTVEALKKNSLASESDLFVFSDGGAFVGEVREIVENITGFRGVRVIKRGFHLGLRQSILSGVSTILDTYSRIIVVEDDIVTSPNFLSYMNACLNWFEYDQRIGSITGYNVVDIPKDYKRPVYFSPRPGSWGWATWANRWDKFRTDDIIISRKDKAGFNQGGDDLYRMLKRKQIGGVESWAIDWAFYHYKNKMYCVYPCVSKVQNIGIGSGVNCTQETTRYDVEIDTSKTFVLGDVNINEDVMDNFRAFWHYSLFKKFKVFINDTFVCPILRRLA